MNLRRLLQRLPHVTCRGSKEAQVTGVCSDSRRVIPGNIFVARKGKRHDGSRYISDAIAAGAVAIATDLYNPSLTTPQLLFPDVRQLEADIAAAYYENPSRDLFTVGITGTNGKTSVAFLTRHLLPSCGMIGTIEVVVGEHHHAATRTTPDVCTVHKTLRDMVRAGCQAAAIEVTSHGLDQGRVAHVDFAVGVFTNLSQDHLDYHGTMEKYAAAKKCLFAQSKRGLFNFDDPYTPFMSEGFTSEKLTFGFGKGADLRAVDVVLGPDQSRFSIDGIPFTIPLVGRFNILNALAAIGVAYFAGASLKEVAERIADAPEVPGRLESVPSALGIHIYVDFAHTPDALRQSLTAARELCQRGRLIVVFGCGGDRDPSKRPEMGRIAGELADRVIITSDNPRSEDPMEICEQVAEPLDEAQIIVDRREAIHSALRNAEPGDLLLIAGRGHEPEQILARRTIPFDDRLVARELAEACS